ncbi:hypothetical protein CONPUDRAFT_166316 [Coniophora puteana RWD-64-598 SS2]|uniref:Nephrocystin 3-like N-terminal domain-containing protein n=1 Tax=Coniophora puteana (strain RWD-64-598) TaxID=741705 RepID=A0A5M3MK11_CONPW|nr:uncharacterized protein CONPUDRAFT_166316 [Coniophora puteana RWD-64-598 SS2]EIW79568.1 hypothetical protein CONPUDRAFT_166316 [Coniophora puteana RWD-64-598 SS2]
MTDKYEIWRRLANEKARGAEFDSNERRPFSQCLPGTRVELLRELDATITQEDRKIIWLFGGSGSGKSSIAYSVAERLRTQERLAATFFFSRKHLTRSGIDYVLPTIAYQIGLLHHRAKDVIIKAIRNDPELLSPKKSLRSQFESLIVAPLRELRRAWEAGRMMIFDAIDEGKTTNGCEPKIRLLVSMFADLVRDADIPISTILCTSRPLPSLESLPQRICPSGLVATFQVESFDALHDVEIFLRQSFQDIYEMRELEFSHPIPWPPEVVLNVLLSQVRGQFIIAATIVRLVHDAPDPTSCINALADMYQGNLRPLDLSLGNIDSVYRYILSDCEPGSLRTGTECLSDIIALAEPLSLSNLCKLAACDVHKRIVNLSAVIYLPSMASTDTVQIYHSSLRDFLADKSRSKEYHVDPAESHRRLACSYFRIMQRELKKDICGLGDPTSKLHSEIEDFEQRGDAAISGALHYACLYWPYHLERTNPDAEVRALVLHLLQKQLFFS